LTPRVAPWAGIGFVVVTLASELLKGDSASPTASAAAIVGYLEEHRSGILSGTYLQMLGLFLFAAVLVFGLERLFPSAPRATLLAGVGGVLVLAAYTAYVLLTAAAAFGAGVDLSLESTKALWQVRFVAETFVAFPAALLVGATAAAALATRGVPQWYAWASVAAAAAFLVGGAALRRYGAFAPDGDYGFLLFWLLPLWTAVTGFVLPAGASEPAGAPRAARGRFHSGRSRARGGASRRPSR
jgi:hypothetical protein